MTYDTMKKHTLLALLAFHLAAFSANATIVINFDTDAYGNPIAAPALTFDAVRLSELYAPLGVHFFGPDGPNGHDGGAILNQDGNFGLNAHSGINVLGFNYNGLLMDGGVARDPETITFDTLASNISIFAAGGHSIKTFLIQGFDANGVLVASDTVDTQVWAELQIAWSLGIKSIQLSVTRHDLDPSTGFVYDDLSIDFVPEPSIGSFLICAGAIGVAWRLRRKKA